MFTPQILSEERLKNSVNTEVFNSGLSLFTSGVVQILDITDRTAICSVKDRRNLRVSVKLTKSHL